MHCKLSIIVPIYNVEKFLWAALESLDLIDDRPYEVFLINDGSSDGSLKICEAYAENHSQVQIISQENKGYGAACNIGLKCAKGDYIAIFEPDDLLGENFYDDLLQAADESQADIVKYNGFYKYGETVIGSSAVRFAKYSGRKLAKELIPEMWVSHPCIWNGIYRRETLLRNHVYFPEGRGSSFQDAQFFNSLYCSCDSVYFVNKIKYYYRQHPSQSVHNADAKVSAIIQNWNENLSWAFKYSPDSIQYISEKTFQQFLTLYNYRLKSRDAKYKLLDGFLKFKRLSGVSRLNKIQASAKARQEFHYIRFYPWLKRYQALKKLFLRFRKNFLSARSKQKPPSAPQQWWPDCLSQLDAPHQAEYASKNSNVSDVFLEVIGNVLITNTPPSALGVLLPNAFFIPTSKMRLHIDGGRVDSILIWKSKPRDALPFVTSIPVLYVNEGIFTSILPHGSAVNPFGFASPLSFVIDGHGSFRNSTDISALEHALNSERSLTPDELLRSRCLVTKVVENRISKFNFQPERKEPFFRMGGGRVLVVDQLYDSVTADGEAVASFDAMLEAAITENPNSQIVIKAHPATIQDGKNRGSGYFNPDRISTRGNIIHVTEPVNPYSLIEVCDKVYVYSSQMGFEALMMRKPTVIFGSPFYAGWGIGEVRNDSPLLEKRQRRRTLEEIFYFTCVDYTHYVNPFTMRPCAIEEFLDALIELRAKFHAIAHVSR